MSKAKKAANRVPRGPRDKGGFISLLDADAFKPVPADWFAGTTDIVNSTGHVANGQYKTVNTVGAAVISALLNGLKTGFPYTFGGDGASFAIPAEEEPVARKAMAAVRAWARDEFGFELRCALAPLTEIRAAGHDVRIAAYKPSANVSYAMFDGGGMKWLETQMRQGRFDVPAAPSGTRPDLTGLSCRWLPGRSVNGTILSLIVSPLPQAEEKALTESLRKIVTTAGGLVRAGHPFPQSGPGFRWPPEGLELEARATRGTKSLWRRKTELWFATLIALFFFKTGMKLGKFDPANYTSTSSANADFRKFADGLMMTVDADPATVSAIGKELASGEANGLYRYGMHQQEEALMTCIVPSVTSDDHLHFVDGAGGGYTLAAMAMKQKSAAAER